MLIDELTNRSVRSLEAGENKLINRAVRFKVEANTVKKMNLHID
jgi:hypothetical protein